MKPQLLHIEHPPVNSFNARMEMVANVNSRWHYHPEMELIYFHKGSGTQFIGDHIKKFFPGDLVLIGPNLPHYWMYDEECYSDKSEKHPFATVIHFKEDLLGDTFMHMPECRNIRTMFELSKRGILFPGSYSGQVPNLMKKIVLSDSMNRILFLLNCLTTLSECSNFQQLSSLGFRYHDTNFVNDRLNKIYQYTMKNFRKKILLGEIAALAGLNPGSFCRFFKEKTGKTYNQLLLELRLGYACKLLLDNNADVKHICYESGFTNFSYFHKGFKDATGFTPQAYRLKYIQSK